MNNVAYTKIARGPEVQKQIIQGAIELAEAVVDTLGPNGYTVVIDRSDGDQLVTKDGVTVARSIKLGNAIRNQGAQIMKQGANKAQSLSGDGTTTATLLAMSILKEIIDMPTNYSVALVKEGMTAAKNDIVQFLNADSLQVDLEDENGADILEAVAYISSNNDSMISDLIVQAISHSKGKNPIKINKARLNKSYVENKEGMIYYNSVHHDFFMEMFGVSNEIALNNARLFITDHEIVAMKDLSHIIEHFFSSSQNVDTRYPLVIIAPDISKSALQGIFRNMTQFKDLKIIALKLPEFGIQQAYTAHDIAIYTGGKAILKSEFESLSDMHTIPVDDILGTARMEISRDQYAIMNGNYDKDALEKRINYLDELIEEEEASYMQDKLIQRKAKLMGNIAIIFVGAETQVEADEIHARVDDAVNAVKGAIAEGVVKGGGVAFLESVEKVEVLREEDPAHFSQLEDYLFGYESIINACKKPFSKILKNAEEDPDIALEILKNSKYSKMYNVRTKEVVDIFENKILDPKKVTVNSLKSAVSIASVLMSTKTSITGFVGKSEK